MTKMLPPALALFMTLTPTVNGVAQTPAAGAKSCAADFEALEAKVRGDDAGFQDKVTAQGREAASCPTSASPKRTRPRGVRPPLPQIRPRRPVAQECKVSLHRRLLHLDAPGQPV
jgi:hypothetical protein